MEILLYFQYSTTIRNIGQSFNLTHIVILFLSEVMTPFLSIYIYIVGTIGLPPSIRNADTDYHTCFLLYIFNAAFSNFQMLDIYWPMYLFHFSLPAVQYPSPLHGHRWITRPSLAQLTEWCCSSENTPLPSYSNGLSAGCPLACRGTQQKIWRDVGGRREGRC